MKNKFYILIVTFFLIINFHLASAASLSVSPSSQATSVGNIFTLKVKVNTGGVYINNAEGLIEFPKDILEVVSISKSSSIFSLWVEEPSFSNTTGTINFNGGIATPGYNGSDGSIFSVTFRAKKIGTASILVSGGAVRKNDGLGTDVLTSKTGASVQIKEQEKIEPDKKVEKKEEVTIIPVFNPSVRLEGMQVIIELSDEKNINNVDYYIIGIDDKPSFKIKKDQLVNYKYYLPVLESGEHGVNIITFDKSGKYIENSLSFVVPQIQIPVLNLSSNEVTIGESVLISGKTNYPNKQVVIYLESNGKKIYEYSQTTGEDGSFSIVTDMLKNKGVISIYSKLFLAEGISSDFSEKIFLTVTDREITKMTLAILYPLIAILLIIFVLLIILFLLYLGWHKYFSLRKEFKNKTKKTIEDVHRVMSLLRKELKDQLETLEKVKIDRKLNDKEESIFGEIKDNIDKVDNFIEKKIKNII